MKGLFILLLSVILLSSIVVAVSRDKNVIYKPYTKPVDGTNIRMYKRVIAEHVDKKAIKLLKGKGCLVRHKLIDAVSFDCPKNISPELNVREARVFYVVDLEADVQIKADRVWTEGIDGSGVTVVVLDTGVQADHEELSDSIIGCKNFVAGEDCNDYNGHGTHVSGIITANGVYNIGDNKATGVAPGASVYMLKVCNADGECYEDDIMAAMEYAVENNIGQVMSISIGGGAYLGKNCDFDPLAQKVNWVVENGIPVVVAAGNNPRGVSSPGCASGAITVGAVDKEGYVTYWSGRGLSLDIVAPGKDILSSYSCLAQETNDCRRTWYAYMSGTSMATPHVAGVVALMLEANPNLSVDEIKNSLYTTADPATGCKECLFILRGVCYGERTVACTPEDEGAGVVNAYKAYLTVSPIECSVDSECDDDVSCTDDSCLNGTCVHQVNDANCPDDGWFDTGKRRWVSTSQCTEKEQKEEEYRDYYCDATLDCQYDVGSVRWVDTGAKRDKPDGTTCDDGQFCTVDDTCQGGVCTGKPRSCDDGEICTSDSCDESMDVCVNIWPECGLLDGCCGPDCDSTTDPDCQAEKCWSAGYAFLKRGRSQFKKFCKCAQGTYGYRSYSYVIGRKVAYKYIDTDDNENWEASAVVTYFPASRVMCMDGKWYTTNQDYYR